MRSLTATNLQRNIFLVFFLREIITYDILLSIVVNHYYEAEVVSEYVIKGNTAVLKCNIPSFVADFVGVDAWIGSDGSEYVASQDFGTTALQTNFYKYLVLIRLSLFMMTACISISFFFFFLIHKNGQNKENDFLPESMQNTTVTTRIRDEQQFINYSSKLISIHSY